jgi:hypothetical protein
VRGSRRFVQRSRVPRHTFVSEPSLGHLDPLLDNPEHNPFLTTVVPFLQRIVGQARNE